MRSEGTRVAVLHVRNRLTHATSTSAPLAVGAGNEVVREGCNQCCDAKRAPAPLTKGIAIGRDACDLDPLVSVAHGTLECTPQHGVWVYVDHSEHGTTLNQKVRIHRDAAIVRDGDVLSLGNTEITLAFQVQQPPRDVAATTEDQNNNNSPVGAPAALTPSPPATPAMPVQPPPPPSQLARQMLPHIQTAASRLQQPPPEYINSPIPGTKWRKKRHSISHVAARQPITLLGDASSSSSAAMSSSQTFARAKPLVPSAPSTPPQKDAPALRHVSHHVAHSPPQGGACYHHHPHHVKFKEEPETAATPEIIPEDESQQQQQPPQQQQKRPGGSPSTHSKPTTPPTPPTTAGTQTLAPSPPLEYSSSPVTIASGKSFLSRLPQHSPSSGAAAPRYVPGARPSPPRAPAAAAPFLHAHHLDTSSSSPPTARASNRPMDLRIQVAKRNAGLASAAAAARLFSGGTTTTPMAAAAAGAAPGKTTTRPAALSRGITIPTPTTTAQRTAKPRRLDFTPPASPVAHQDILRQNQSLLNILKHKYREEQKLKREQEEWMRTQFPASVVSSPSRSATVPSLSPIRHVKKGTPDNNNDDGDDDDEDDHGEDLVVPAKAPALLRTVSLGQTMPVAAHHYHQPSPRLTQAVLASRARKGSFDSGRHRQAGLSGGAIVSPRAHAASLEQAVGPRSRGRSSSGGSSVASSVSTEPSNYRRVMRSQSFSSSRAESLGELSDFLGYDDDDAADGLLSFTSYYGDGGLDDTVRAPTSSSTRTTANTMAARGAPSRRGRAPSLDDEMAGVLNSPSHASSSSSSFGRHSAFEATSKEPPRSVAKPRARSADVRRSDRRRAHQLGIDLDRSPH